MESMLQMDEDRRTFRGVLAVLWVSSLLGEWAIGTTLELAMDASL